MKVKTYELEGSALDWAVAKCERITVSFTPPEPSPRLIGVEYEPPYDPHRNWNLGGPIIEREGIKVERGNDLIFPKGNEKGGYFEPLWLASYKPQRKFHGPTPLIAAMRCFVASKLGDEVEIPEALCSN